MAKVEKFKFWCQKVLPLVYDDSLSYYEVLCKLVTYLNKTIGAVNENTEDIDNLTLSFNKLHDYVNNYFDNLDVQEEINNKLDKMAENGTLGYLIGKYLPVLTPETYGAIGDGINDDTLAVQRCINEVLNNSLYTCSTIRGWGIYKITDNIIIHNTNQFKAYDIFLNSIIAEIDDNYALEISGVTDSSILNINYLKSTKGGIHIYSTDEITDFIQYMTIKGKRINAVDTCIKLEGTGTGYVNNCYIEGFRFQYGAWGVELVNSHANCFTNCGFEYSGVHIVTSDFTSFIHCRMAEPTTENKLLKTEGKCSGLELYGGITAPGAQAGEIDTRFELSNQTDGFMISQPIGYGSPDELSNANYYIIRNGNIIPFNANFVSKFISNVSEFNTSTLRNGECPSFIVTDDILNKLSLDKKRYYGSGKINEIYLIGNNNGLTVDIDGQNILTIPEGDNYSKYRIIFFNQRVLVTKLDNTNISTIH